MGFLAAAAMVVAVVGVVRQRWVWAVIAVALAIACGPDRHSLIDGLNVVVFLEGMVIVAAAADRSGLLARIAGLAGRVAHRPLAVLAVTYLVGVAVTTLLNLDTTAVLFTPLAVNIGRRLRQPVAPFAMASILAANFGSLLLPSSNLTNLVVQRRTHADFAAQAVRLGPAWLAAVVLVGAVLLVWARPHLSFCGAESPHSAPSAPENGGEDPVLARLTVVALVVLLAAFLLGAPVAAASAVVAAALVGVRRDLWSARLPWPLLISLLALFGAAGTLAGAAAVRHRTQAIAGQGDVALAAAGAAGSAVVTNLAAVLLLSPAARSAAASRSLLVGVDLGVGLTPVGSLATILWRDSLAARGDRVSMRTYLMLGAPISLGLVPLCVALAR